MYELKQLSDETGMFGSISDDDINAAAGVTWKDDTALKDPLSGIGGEVSSPFDVTVADFMTIDYKGQPRDENGKFTFGKLGGKRKSSLKKQSKSDKMSKREIDLVSSGILTDHPKFEPGSYHGYYYGKYYYIFTAQHCRSLTMVWRMRWKNIWKHTLMQRSWKYPNLLTPLSLRLKS